LVEALSIQEDIYYFVSLGIDRRDAYFILRR